MDRNAKLRADLEFYLSVNRSGIAVLRRLKGLPDEVRVSLEATERVFADIDTMLRGEELDVHVAEVRL